MCSKLTDSLIIYLLSALVLAHLASCLPTRLESFHTKIVYKGSIYSKKGNCHRNPAWLLPNVGHPDYYTGTIGNRNARLTSQCHQLYLFPVASSAATADLMSAGRLTMHRVAKGRTKQLCQLLTKLFIRTRKIKALQILKRPRCPAPEVKVFSRGMIRRELARITCPHKPEARKNRERLDIWTP
jgi:hypothetical protein